LLKILYCGIFNKIHYIQIRRNRPKSWHSDYQHKAINRGDAVG